jgi:predicted nucleic acid-binding protein
MPKYVVDTNLYIEAITTDDGNEALTAFQRRFAPVLYQHSTVAQEILAGARDAASFRAYHKDWIAPFEDLGRIITPSQTSWLRAARIVTRLIVSGRMSAGGFNRSFLNDCLIAASALEHGFILVTRNATDFARIHRVEPTLTYTAPWPER